MSRASLRKYLGITKLEKRMSASEDKLTEIDTVTTEIADKIAALVGSDAALAEKLQPHLDRLRGIDADLDNPVPPPVPAPAV